MTEATIKRLRTTICRGGLESYRDRLDEIDDQIAHLLGERFDICRAVAHYKSAHDIPMMQPDRVAAVRARYLAAGPPSTCRRTSAPSCSSC